MFKDTIKNFNEQFKYGPEIQNHGNFGKYKKFIVVGMGGSNLAAGIIKSWKPKLDVVVHRDYGLPNMVGSEIEERLIIPHLFDRYNILGSNILVNIAYGKQFTITVSFQYSVVLSKNPMGSETPTLLINIDISDHTY